MPYDVITFGEAMVRLSPPGSRRVEQATTLEVEVGGAELNAAAGLAQLGRRTVWVSRLTDNPLGRLIASRARLLGVSTEHILWTDADRVGLFFLEDGAAPRPPSITYDRKDSAIARIQPGMVPWADVFAGARWLHVTGITPALSPGAAAVTREALTAARASGLSISLDPNYRAKLWTIADAGRCLCELLPMCDVLITTAGDAAQMFGADAPAFADAARQLVERFGVKVVVFTERQSPGVWRNVWTARAFADGREYGTATYDVEIIDRVGAGDAFAAGLIHGLLDGDVQKAVDWGTALGAWKHSVPGDMVWITPAEVEAVLQGGGLRIRR